MLGNWAPQIHRPEFRTDQENDIALELCFIKKVRKNMANRFGFGITQSDNIKLGETINQEDTILRAIHMTSFNSYYVFAGREWRKNFNKHFMLISSFDAVFGMGKSYNSYTRAITNKESIDHSGLPSISYEESADHAALTPSIGLRLFFQGFALSYSISAPWQFQYSQHGDMIIFNNYIRPKHVIRIGLGFRHRS